MTQAKRVGFIGLGMMGAPMVQCLRKAGFELFIDDADAARADTLAEQSGSHRLNADNAGSLDALITMLPNSAIVEAVVLGDGNNTGWAARLAKGAVVIDMSSSEPERSRALGKTLEAQRLAYLDAPVSGGVKRAKEGTLAILVGGHADVLARCKPLLDAMGTNVLHIGTAGAGHAAKALNNYVSAASVAATVEALQIASRFGIDPQVMTDVLNASTGRSNTSENKAKQFMLSGTFASGFALQLMNKDLKIARALAQAVGHPMTFGATCVEVWDQAAQRSTPATDHTELYRLLPGAAS
ncbi:NAD binding domain of 6-phosphogluconate dehydrogenase family protein [Paraburkholderia xenovorans LB400]|uniref:3-hydroxyisobutyrate dehydrogenase n=1 Tax=Paraburkholderia xenovorans (strain LB400) TaxID=266265 RepID=Q13LQ9_PARXL|nr:NAD(P)-dependent oxidoreductase [Paraburkholderia xenovorans]ABE34980.1 3-hydroxyisobutyrate dehydrogenase [Paraburkholderia xenovorans LB400]AIP37826.1 NAD binding domain of 6-phosphogluconate dehydrogenase family protein [Paraburkholderia xenovorans LB400]